MHTDYETFLGKLRDDVADSQSPKPARIVSQHKGTQIENPYLTSPAERQFSGASDVDGLFGDSVSYQAYKREKPEHRLILWLRLQGHNVKETAALSGYTPQSVSQICKQPWFREAFCRLAKEHGQDAMKTLIEGEAMPAFQRLVELANGSESDQVRLAANKEILDRFLGKPVAKTETKVSGSIDQTIYDASKLMEENARVQKELAARGIGQHGTN